MDNIQKMERHNYLLNHMKKLLEIDETKLSKEQKQQLLLEETKVTTEIEKIRKELGVNTSTVITEEDLKEIESK